MLDSPENIVSTHLQSEKFISSLKNDIFETLPILKKGTNILLEGELSHHQTGNDVLRGHVCGRTVEILGFLLRQKGYKSEGLKNDELGIKYPGYDHAINIVIDPNNAEKIIVDAAYLQFFDIFFLDRSNLPKEDVLVTYESNILKKAEEFAQLRDIKIKLHHNPEVLYSEAIPFKMSTNELIKYFQKIWDLKRYKPIERTLEDDIVSYKRNPKNVSFIKKKLIEELQLV